MHQDFAVLVATFVYEVSSLGEEGRYLLSWSVQQGQLVVLEFIRKTLAYSAGTGQNVCDTELFKLNSVESGAHGPLIQKGFALF